MYPVGRGPLALYHVDHGPHHQPNDCYYGDNQADPVGVDEVDGGSDEDVLLFMDLLTILQQIHVGACVFVCVFVCVWRV